MSEFIEYKKEIAFHPGYYIREIMEEENLTQEDFAAKLDTSPKNMSYLLRCEQSISPAMARKVATFTNTNIILWLNIQAYYDSILEKIALEEELKKEEEILKAINYSFFVNNFNLPKHSRKTEEQIKEVRSFLGVSSLVVLKNKNLCTCYRSQDLTLSEKSTIAGNVMIQIAIKLAKDIEAPKYDKAKFKEAYIHALTLTKNHENFFSVLKQEFQNAGVIVVALPSIPGSKINGACKKLKDNILLIINDRNTYADSFWFTLFHEIGHITHGDYGISTVDEMGEKEKEADNFARNMLIDKKEYQRFIQKGIFTQASITSFSSKISRDPGIIVGRLQKDGLVKYSNMSLNALKTKYKINTI